MKLRKKILLNFLPFTLSEIFNSNQETFTNIFYQNIVDKTHYLQNPDPSFGFSLAVADVKTNQKNILIGAPRDNNSRPPNNRRGHSWNGEIYSCDFVNNGKTNCGTFNSGLQEVFIGQTSNRVLRKMYGQNIQYDSDNDRLMTCAPTSIDQKATEAGWNSISYSTCQVQNDYGLSSNRIYNIYSNSVESSKKIGDHNMGYAACISNWDSKSSRAQTRKESILLTSAPTSYDEQGTFQYKKLSNADTASSEITDVRNINLKSNEIIRNRKGISITNFLCKADPNNSRSTSLVRHVAVGTTDPDGEIIIYQLDRTGTSVNSNYRKSLRSESPVFGGSFGFSQVTVEINGSIYLLVSSPFGTYGKLELFEACSRKSANHLLVDMPTNIKKFGYSLENIGNVDNIEGDEILVGGPSKDEGSVSVLSVRSGKLIYVQKITSDRVEYLGLAISPNAVNLDEKAGKDIVVSGKDSVVVILSKPTFSLSADADFTITQNGQKVTPSRPIYSDRPVNGEEKIKVCVTVSSNVRIPSRLAISADLSLDAERSAENKRYEYVDQNFKGKLSFSYIRALSNSATYHCSQDILISRKQNNMLCPTNKYLSIDEIKFALSNIQSNYEIKANLKPAYIASDNFQTFGAFDPEFDCKGSNQCTKDLAIAASIKHEKIALTKTSIDKDVTLSIYNRGQKLVQNTFVKISTDADSGVVRVVSPACQSTDENTWHCHYGDNCALQPNSQQELFFKILIDSINSSKQKFNLNYALIKDNQPIPRKAGSIEYEIDIDFSTVITTKYQPVVQYDPFNESAKKSEKVTMSVMIENPNEIVNYQDYTTKIDIPVSFIDTEGKTHNIWIGPIAIRNAENQRIYDANFQELAKSSTPNNFNTNLKAGELGINYQRITIASNGGTLLEQHGIEFKIVGTIDRSIYELDGFPNGFSKITARVGFVVETFEGVRFINSGNMRELALKHGQTLEYLTVKEYNIQKDFIDQSKLYLYGGAIGAIILLIILIVLCATGCFKDDKNVFIKEAPIPETEEESAMMSSSRM